VLVGGGAGTLSEAAYAWQLDRPIIALSTTGGWAAQLAGQGIDQRPRRPVLDAKTPQEAVELAHSAIADGQGRGNVDPTDDGQG